MYLSTLLCFLISLLLDNNKIRNYKKKTGQSGRDIACKGNLVACTDLLY